MTIIALLGLYPLEGRAAVAPLSGLTGGEADFFERNIRPVLVERCYSCHSEKAGKAEGGLRLDTAEATRKGGSSGPLYISGDPARSRLIEVMRRPHPEGSISRDARLPRHLLRDFDSWIRFGAPDPRSPGSPAPVQVARPTRQHWAFLPIKDPPAPPVRQSSWVRDPIDQFILARLEKAGVKPAPPADRAAWLRRATFDLTGLPPTSEELGSFLADQSPKVIEQTIERLLNSPRFGEHWGRIWLQTIGYADAEPTTVHDHAWRYRDYVIGAFNSDKPYDQFIREQLAGDLLSEDDELAQRERRIATGFLLAGTPLGAESDPATLTLDVADGQLETVSRTFLALSVTCARCHDHKSDPISTREYQALAGIFTSTASLADGAEDRRRGAPRWAEISLASPEQLDAIDEFETRFEELKEQLREAREMRVAFPGEIDSAALAGVVVDNLAAEVQGTWKESNYSTNFVDQNYLHDGDADKGKKSARFVPDLPKAGLYEVLVAYTPRANRATNVPVTITSKDGVKTVPLNQTLTPKVDKVFASVGRFNFDAGSKGSIVIANTGTRGFVVADAVRLVPVEKSAGTVAADANDGNAPEAALLNYRQLEREVLEFRTKRPVMPQAMAVREGKVADYRVRSPGATGRPGDPVPRGFPAVFGTPDSTLYVITDESSGRLELAHWLARRDNPLTARVLVNRVWAQLFGIGLVPSLNDFGPRGDLPTNPELLDHLAGRFVDQGSSIKKLIRAIMLSSAYGMSSAAASTAAKDPANALLSRMNERSLAPEVLRDAMLMLGRRLEGSAGGSWMPTNTTATGLQALRRAQTSSWRRSVYVPVIRDRPSEALRSLNFSTASQTADGASPGTPERSRFLADQAWAWSDALLRLPFQNETERIVLAYRESLTRDPSDVEIVRAEQLLRRTSSGPGVADQPRQQISSAGWEAFCKELLSSAEFRLVR